MQLLHYKKPSDHEVHGISPSSIASLPIEDIFTQFHSSIKGLTAEQVEFSRTQYGKNVLIFKERKSLIIQFLEHFKSPIILILVFAGILSALFQDLVSAIIIFVILLLSIIIDFVQETTAGKAVDALKKRVSTTATVLRDGIKQEIEISLLVLGDIISLSSGDIIPADARIIKANDFYVDQSALTGESFPIEKFADPISGVADASKVKGSNYLLMGSSIISGSALGIVVKLGSFTEYGKIANRIHQLRPETEFEKGMKRFSVFVIDIIFMLVVFVFLINALEQENVFESLLFSLALAVGLTPDLLPMIITLTLSKGAIEMAKKDVIVKRLPSIQNFGSMDVLCTDKTGTLTENQVTVVLHIDLEGKNDEKTLLYSYLNSFFQTGLKSPLDEAILRTEPFDMKSYQKIDEIPFDFIRKRVSVIIKKESDSYLYVKGAPDSVIQVCSQYELNSSVNNLTPEIKNKIQQKFVELSAEGYRLLGVSYKKVTSNQKQFSPTDEIAMVFVGFVAFLDPPKQSAKTALEMLEKSHIELKILTGDNELVTKHICKELDIEIKGILLGPDIAEMRNDILVQQVEKNNVFARVTPAQKDQIIMALKKNRHIVGFMGDGINDAPSMREADVSISVDTAVDVAKESADLILMKKDLDVLHDGVVIGRKTFSNSSKYIRMAVSSNFGNMLSVAGASLFLPFLPMLPTQILLNNLLYDICQFTIPTDNVDPEIIERPKKLDIADIRRFMLFFGPLSSVFDFITFFILMGFHAPAPLFQTVWFLESFCSQTLVLFVIRTRRVPFWKSSPSRALFISNIVVVLFVILLPYLFIGELFNFIGPPIYYYAILVPLIGIYIFFVEILKIRFFHSKRQVNL